MSSPSQAYLDNSAERFRNWQDLRLSEPLISPVSKSPSLPVSKSVAFPPAALRPWSRPLIKPRVSKSPRLPLSKSSAP